MSWKKLTVQLQRRRKNTVLLHWHLTGVYITIFSAQQIFNQKLKLDSDHKLYNWQKKLNCEKIKCFWHKLFCCWKKCCNELFLLTQLLTGATVFCSGELTAKILSARERERVRGSNRRGGVGKGRCRPAGWRRKKNDISSPSF